MIKLKLNTKIHFSVTTVTLGATLFLTSVFAQGAALTNAGTFLTKASVSLVEFSDVVASQQAPPWSQKPNPKYPLPPHLRGVHISVKNANPAILKHLALKWGANYITLSMRADAFAQGRTGKPGPKPTLEDPLRPYKQGLKRLENVVLPACKKYNLRVLFEFNPWGRVQYIDGKKHTMKAYWQDSAEGQKLRSWFPVIWKAMAKRLKNNKIVVAFDPLAEPNYRAGTFGQHAWQDIMLPKAVKAIRSVNKYIWLEVAPGPWGGTGGYKTLKPIDDPYVIYAFHFYYPHMYTHQGVRGYAKGLKYPGMLQQFPASPKIMWNKQTLEKMMMPAIKFAKANHARVLCGEFGVIRWAPGRKQWISDVISLFEEYNIGWSWHNPAGWNGWNLAFGPDADPVKKHGGPVAGTMASFNDGNITPALRVIIDTMRKNPRYVQEHGG